jgi:hypothetical protein
MDTSRRRTPPAPVSPGPEGVRTACRGSQKTSKSPFGFSRKLDLFASARAGKSCKSALLTIAVSLSGSADRHSSLTGRPGGWSRVG